MFDWLIKKGFKVVWKKVFGVDPVINSEDDKLINSAADNLEKQLGVAIKGNFFDRLIDDINRLPRPIMTFGVIFMFFMAIYNPLLFATWMVALQGIPTNLWYIMATIVLFWFGGRIIEKSSLVDKTPEYAKMITELQKHKETLKYTSDLKDETKPLSQDAIDAWNKKNNPNYKK